MNPLTSPEPPASTAEGDAAPTSGRCIDGIPVAQFALRLFWIAARIVAVAYLGHSGATFFYQGF